MDKDLPNIFKGSVKNDNNQNKTILGESNNTVDNNKDIDREIKDIFNSNDFVYKADVLITLNDNNPIKKTIIGRSNNSLITIDDELIDIKDISKIELI